MVIKKFQKKDGKYIVAYDVNKQHDQKDSYIFTSGDAPKASLLECLWDLRRAVITICELGEIPVENIRITAVTFTQSENNGLGVVITAERQLELTDASLILNTPIKYEDSGDAKKDLPASSVNTLYQLKQEIESYIEGDREQGNLFVGELALAGAQCT